MSDSEEKTTKRTVLVAMDGSEPSSQALRWYAKNLYRQGDKVFVTYCSEDVTYPPLASLENEVEIDHSQVDEVEKEHEREVEIILQELDDMAKPYKLHHRVKRLTGSPGEAIVQAASDQHADLIVCGSRGHGAIKRIVLGSVSDYILNHSLVPCIVCKQVDNNCQ